MVKFLEQFHLVCLNRDLRWSLFVRLTHTLRSLTMQPSIAGNHLLMEGGTFSRSSNEVKRDDIYMQHAYKHDQK
jgi:hypothetical protein